MGPNRRLEQENRVLREMIGSLGQFSKELLARIEAQDIQMLRLKEILDQIVKRMGT